LGNEDAKLFKLIFIFLKTNAILRYNKNEHQDKALE